MLAVEFDGDGNLHRSREFFDAASRWFDRSGDEAKSAEMTVAVAEGWVKEAIARVTADQPSHMVAASFFMKKPSRSTVAFHAVSDQHIKAMSELPNCIGT